MFGNGVQVLATGSYWLKALVGAAEVGVKATHGVGECAVAATAETDSEMSG